MSDNDWFKSWFNTPYYHILYKHRDHTEAESFIDHIIDYLNPSVSSKVLDLACGRGRHAVYLNKKGFDVVGLDLSDESIAFANESSNASLSFEVKDMRQSFGENRFDYIFNLFTSFGYFDTDDENLLAIQQMAKALKKDGLLLIDFMNTHLVEKGLIPVESKIADGIEFKINRIIRDDKIIKQISFEDNDQHFQFEERVCALSLLDFERYADQAGLKIVSLFGGFELEEFDIESSDRLILMAQRK
jgi:SAM-dependent methyltransferase